MIESWTCLYCLVLSHLDSILHNSWDKAHLTVGFQQKIVDREVEKVHWFIKSLNLDLQFGSINGNITLNVRAVVHWCIGHNTSMHFGCWDVDSHGAKNFNASAIGRKHKDNCVNENPTAMNEKLLLKAYN